MKRKSCLFFWAVIFLFAHPFPSYSADSSQNKTVSASLSLRVAVLDLPEVLDNCLAGKEVMRKLEDARKSLTEEFNKKSQEFDKTGKELSDKRGVLAQEVFDQQVKDFTENVSEAQKKMKEKGAKLDAAYTRSREVIIKRIELIVADISKRDAIGMVFPKLPSPFVATAATDITKEVMDRLDVEVPSVEVKID